MGRQRTDTGVDWDAPGQEDRQLATDFTVKDATGASWALSDHLDSAVVITFNRGDF